MCGVPGGKSSNILRRKDLLLTECPRAALSNYSTVLLGETRFWLLLAGAFLSDYVSGQRRARRPAGGPAAARKTSKIRRWGVSEISRRRPRRRGRIQRAPSKADRIGNKVSRSRTHESVMRHATAHDGWGSLTCHGVSDFDLAQIRKDLNIFS